MPSEQSRIAQRLPDILFNIEAVTAFVADMTREQFAENLLVYYGTLRGLEIVSEASRHLPQDLKDRHPEIRWRDIRDAGNVYRHEYMKVSIETIWDTVAVGLPPLRHMAESELAGMGIDRRTLDR
jgi:uncharacterized protein with HEPN domain